MRGFGQCAAVVSLAGVALVRAQTPPVEKETAATILAAARQALGGEAKLAAIKSFVAIGRTRQIRGNNLVPIEFEIACELPDKYVRKDEIPAQESDPTSTGFNGDSLIQIPPPAAPPPRAGAPTAASGAARSGEPPAGSAAARSGEPPASGAARPGGPPPGAGPSTALGPGRPGGPPMDPRRARVNTAKQDFVKLTLGMLATSFSSYPLTFTRAGQAEAPQGKADVIDVKGPDGSNFNAKLFINSQTHLPIMVSWQMPPSSVVVTAPGQPAPSAPAPGTVVVEGPAPPAATASKEELDKYAKDVADVRRKAQTRTVEHRMYYADYRDAGNGLMFPFRLRRAIGVDTVEETNFDAFKINQKIDPRKFEPVK